MASLCARHVVIGPNSTIAQDRRRDPTAAVIAPGVSLPVQSRGRALYGLRSAMHEHHTAERQSSSASGLERAARNRIASYHAAPDAPTHGPDPTLGTPLVLDRLIAVVTSGSGTRPRDLVHHERSFRRRGHRELGERRRGLLERSCYACQCGSRIAHPYRRTIAEMRMSFLKGVVPDDEVVRPGLLGCGERA